jgi:hydroxyacylglutathione hydrolase
MLEVVTLDTAGLGDRSYLVHDGDVALVIDPQRDIDRVQEAAAKAGVRITHVAETHIHNDYVSGGLDLARSTGGTYLVAAAEEVSFERFPVAEGDEIAVGTFGVRVLHTPGHTAHHLSYLVYDGAKPVALFSGGSLLYGTVGRTDLVSPTATEELTRAQFRSVRRLASELPEEVGVWPTHGFGSFCSSAKSSGATTSTIKSERASNIALSTDHEDDFVETLLAGLTTHPTYYAHMAPINRSGPPPFDLTAPERLDPNELRRRVEAGAWVVDLTTRRLFASGHLPGSVSFELGDSFATYVGWVIPWGTPITLVGDSSEQVSQAQRALARIGIDRVAGAATGSRAELAADQPLRSYPVADFPMLARALDAGNELTVLDVRRDDERAGGGIEGSVHIPLQHLLERLNDLPPRTLWVHCATGFRASIASSLLDRAGHDVVHIDDEWSNASEAGLVVVAPPARERPKSTVAA